MSRSSMGPLVSARRPARVRAGEPSRRDTYRRERPPQRRGGDGTPGGTLGGTPPRLPNRASGEKGGVAPVSPLSAGAVRVGRSRTNNPNNDSEQWKGGMGHPPPAVFGTPPPLSASRVPCHGACHGTGHGRGAPSDRHLGGGQPDGGPEREAVNRPSRRRRGGRALGELLQQLKTICRRVEPAGRAQAFTIAGSDRVLTPGDFLADFRVRRALAVAVLGPAFQDGRGAVRGLGARADGDDVHGESARPHPCCGGRCNRSGEAGSGLVRVTARRVRRLPVLRVPRGKAACDQTRPPVPLQRQKAGGRSRL